MKSAVPICRIARSSCRIGRAINTANSNPGADVINLAAGSTYELTSVNNLTDGSNGLPDITSQITINGNGATIKSTVDRRVFVGGHALATSGVD